MARHADRSHSRTAAPMGDAKGLVQIQVADIRADIARAAESHLGIHIGSIHIDLSAMCMDDLADASHIRFEDPVSRRVGQHEG